MKSFQETIEFAKQTFKDGRPRYEVCDSDDKNYVTIKVRRGVFRHLINAAYVGISVKHQEQSGFPPSVCGMVWDLRERTKDFHLSTNTKENL